MYVTFQSDTVVEGRGFVAHYKVLSILSGEQHLVKTVNISSRCIQREIVKKGLGPVDRKIQ